MSNHVTCPKCKGQVELTACDAIRHSIDVQISCKECGYSGYYFIEKEDFIQTDNK